MPKIVPPPDPTEQEEPGAQIARWLGPAILYPRLAGAVASIADAAP